jgi:hypothetical protein
MPVSFKISRLSGAVAMALMFGVAAPASATVVIDGKLDEPEWEQAIRYSDFKVTEPFRLTSPEAGKATEARLLSTPDGIVVGFKLQQAPGIQRVKPRLERDNGDVVDSVNFIVDFDGDGNSGYLFNVGLSGAIQDGVVSNENVISYDWDTDWSWAVTETEDGWQVEMQIPWTVAPMRATDTPTRNMKVYFSRQLGGTSERMSYPAVSTERGTFLSAFERVEIPQYRKALFHYWPYVTANTDLITGKTKYKTGVDVFWKPSPNFQVSATVNPDFGQVEADDLVVNFDAIEVFFSDRRPFFTENQSLFDVRTADGSSLVNTRRIGANADDGSGASDIDAAVKLNGSLGGVNYGLLAATEADDAGRDFYAARLLYPVNERVNIGWLGTYVDRPFLDRTAQVHEFDLLWRPAKTLLLNGQVLGSFIDRAGTRTDDIGAWLRANWTPTNAWTFRFEGTHFGKDLNFNDLGFMRRNSLNELKGIAAYTHRVKAEDSALSNIRWQFQLMGRENDVGDRLPGSAVIVNNYTFRNGNRINANFSYFTEGYDDLISRRNGLWKKSSRNRTEVSFSSRRYGDWVFGSEVSLSPAGLSSELSRQLNFSVGWYPSDTLNMYLELSPESTEDWLIWEGGRYFGRYQRESEVLIFNLDWFPSARHELRVKAEWLALRASEGREYLLNANGGMTPTGAPLSDFDVNSLAFQVRYRFLIGAQSDFYLAYSRGGEETRYRMSPDLGDQFDEALSLRDSDQFLVKLRYRF